MNMINLTDWDEMGMEDREMYARLDVVLFLKETGEDGYNQLMSAWDESAMEMGDDFYNNAEGVGSVFVGRETYAENSYVGSMAFTYLKGTMSCESMLKWAQSELDHYWEDKIINSVQGASAQGAEELASSYYFLEMDDLDADYIYTEVDCCVNCGWTQPCSQLNNINDELVCDDCEEEYKEDNDLD